MAGAAKNWETQAKTNSVLAAALKALDERLTELEQLQQWKMDVESQLEELADESVVLRKRLDTVKPDNNAALNRMRTGANRIAPDDGESKDGTAPLKSSKSTGSRGIKFADEKLPLLQFLAIKSRDFLSYLIAILQIALCGPLAYEVYNTEDTYTRGLAGLLACTGLVSGVFTLIGVRWMLKRPLALAFSLQIWLVCVAASYMETSARDVQKVEKLCSLSFVEVQDCSFRRQTAYARTGYGAGSILLSILLAYILTLQRDEVIVMETMQNLSRRLKHLAPSGKISRAVSRFGSTAVMKGPAADEGTTTVSVYSAKSGKVFDALEGLTKGGAHGDSAAPLLEAPPAEPAPSKPLGALSKAPSDGLRGGGSKRLLNIPEDVPGVKMPAAHTPPSPVKEEGTATDTV